MVTALHAEHKSPFAQYWFRSVPDDMVFIHGGEYEMGDHYAVGAPQEKPVHLVYVDSFFMDIYEITNQQYCDYLNWALSEENVIEVRDEGDGQHPARMTTQLQRMVAAIQIQQQHSIVKRAQQSRPTIRAHRQAKEAGLSVEALDELPGVQVPQDGVSVLGNR